ncbi:MAG: hypothetical protein ACTTHG_07435 [Treponemataceae bacterium]
MKSVKQIFVFLIFLFTAVFFNISSLFSQTAEQSFSTDTKFSVSPNPWSIIIYRPQNNYELNHVKCWITVTDAQTGEDVTYSDKIKAKYEWVANTQILENNEPKSFFTMFKGQLRSFFLNYQKTYWLMGGVAMHLNIKPGKYIFSITTPYDETSLFPIKNSGDWTSNRLFYDTENPTNVIFVCPSVDENGLYNGGWHIDYFAPKYWKFTKGCYE